MRTRRGEMADTLGRANHLARAWRGVQLPKFAHPWPWDEHVFDAKDEKLGVASLGWIHAETLRSWEMVCAFGYSTTSMCGAREISIGKPSHSWQVEPHRIFVFCMQQLLLAMTP